MRVSTLRALTGSALTLGVLGVGATAAAADTYEVKPGDTLAQIAQSHGLDSWQSIYQANADKLSDPNRIFPGQQLRLSTDTSATATTTSTASSTEAASGATYTVRSGDTLAAIGQAHGVSWQSLYESNRDQLSSPSRIFPGQTLQLSGTSSTTTTGASEASTSTTTTAPSSIEPQGTVSMATWDRLAQCESSGDWSINTGNGYYGGLQFALSSWQWVGGTGYPHEASKSEQIARAELLLERQGWNAWPACSRQLGLR